MNPNPFITALVAPLASFSISKPTPGALEALRYRGWRGGKILPHRAFARLRMGAREMLVSLSLVLSLSAVWLAMLPAVGRFWGRIFVYWTHILGFENSVMMAPQHWGRHISFSLPYVNMAAGPPDPYTWWTTGVVTLLLFAATYGISEENLPWVYLLRFLVAIQGTALIYFAFAAARFPHDLASYTVGMLFFNAILIELVPPILGFTYYLFDFSVLQKITLTVLTGGYLTLLVPMQYMLHVYLLHRSILFMPLLYFAFGPFVDVLVFVSLYSWGMSWKPQGKLVV
jgi:hypothetical protein